MQNKLKRIFLFILTGVLIVSLLGCGGSQSTGQHTDNDSPEGQTASNGSSEQEGLPGSEQTEESKFIILSGGTEGDYYVSTQGKDEWSGTLAEPNAEGTDGPFQTITKAKEVIREQIANGMTQDITVIIRGGEYFLPTTLLFEQQDSGRDGYQVIYRNYQGEEPIINGGTQVVKWEPYNENIYVAKVNPFYKFSTLYENGERSILARYPNEGYNKVDKMMSDDPNRKFGYKKGDIPDIENPRDLQAFVWAGGTSGEWNWFSDTTKVHELDTQNRIVTLLFPAHYELGKGSRYFIQGALELLDQPGEFYLDKKAGMLYYWPRKLPIEEQIIVTPRSPRVVWFKGVNSDQPVENITLEGMTLRNSDITEEYHSGSRDDGMVYMENGRNITIKGCKIHNAGLHGVFMSGWNQNNLIYGNLIYDIGHTGIQINGTWGANYGSKNNIISNNYLYNLGQLVGHGAGIQLNSSGGNEITYNRIHNASRYAISLKGSPPGSMEGQVIDGVEITRENAYQYNYTRDNYIAYNDLFNVNTDSQDTGVIESWGAGRGNRIHNNAIHDSNINFSFGFGLYLDDASNYYTATNNVIYNLQKAGGGRLEFSIFSKGVGNEFYNNMTINNNGKAAFGSMEMAGEPNKELTVERNIFYNSGNSVYHFVNWAENRFTSADYNLAFNPEGKYEVGNVPGVKSFEGWKGIMDGKYDQHSMTQDPMLMDAENGDFRLQYNSPAYDLGFKDIDFADIGLKQDFPFRKMSDPLERLYLKAGDFYSTIDLGVNQEIQPEVVGRTWEGLAADLSEANVKYSIDDENIAEITDAGKIKAKGKGIAKVTVSVSMDGVSKSISTFIRVK